MANLQRLISLYESNFVVEQKRKCIVLSITGGGVGQQKQNLAKDGNQRFHLRLLAMRNS